MGFRYKTLLFLLWALAPFLAWYYVLLSKPHHLFDELVVFGDSVTDTGNGYAMMNHTWPSDPAYYNGRYSNGPLWVEGLQYRLGIEMKNYAVSGATTDNDRVQGWDGRVAENLMPSAVDQINTYLEEISHSRKRVGRGLFVFLIGMNDPIFDANMTAEGTTEVISGLLNRLRALGARGFLIGSYYDYSHMPDQVPKAHLELYCSALRTSLSRLSTKKDVAFVDFYQLFNDILEAPGHWGFDASKKYVCCLTGTYVKAPRTLCDDPEKYVWWDEWHPTRKAHDIMGELAAKEIEKTFRM